MNFCSNCGKTVRYGLAEGEDRPRFVCDHCQTIHYQNPNIVAGCLPIWGDKVLLCKRAIPPRKGFWNVPGGYMENGETVEEGAAREVWEEANIRVKPFHLQMLFSIARINQVYMHFLADLPDLSFSCGVESLEVQLFAENEIPWKEIAFTSSHYTLRTYFQDRKLGRHQLHRTSYEEYEAYRAALKNKK